VWLPLEDAFKFTVANAPNFTITRRSVLSCISRLYDPLVWAAPVVVVAKILIQELWLAKLEWDSPLPPELHDRWTAYSDTLSNLEIIRIPRWTGRSRNNVGLEIHGFADASTRAYAAVVYIRVLHSLTEFRVSLLVAKTKVTPIKVLSIPRLELNAIVLLSRLICWTVTALGCPDVPRYG